MAESRIIGYKKIFGLVLPDWVNEGMIRTLGIGLLSVAVMFLVLIFLIRPNMETIKVKEADVKTGQEALAQLKKSQEGLNRISSEIPPSAQKRILAAIPSEYSPDAAIFALRRISADTGVSIISYTLPSGVLLDTEGSAGNINSANMVDFSSFPIRLTVAAPVEALIKFIAEVESSLPFGVVSDLNLQEVTKLVRLGDSKQVQMDLEIRYYQTILGKVNLNKLQPLSEADLNTIKLLDNYNLLTISEGEDTNIPTASGSGEIFGF